MRAAIAALAFAMLVLLGIAAVARAHDDMDWVMRAQLKNAANEWCCGKGDCEVVERIQEVSGGWLLPDHGNEFVPYAEAIPASQNGKFVRCHRYDGTRRCFIAPPSGS
jgi:hypothetical protein